MSRHVFYRTCRMYIYVLERYGYKYEILYELCRSYLIFIRDKDLLLLPPQEEICYVQKIMVLYIEMYEWTDVRLPFTSSS